MVNKNPSNLNAKSGGFGFSVLVVCYLIVTLLFSIIIVAASLQSGSDAYLYLSYLVSPLAIAAGIYVTSYTQKFPLKSVAKAKCSPKYILIGLLLVFGLLFSLGWVNEVCTKFFTLLGYEAKESSSYLPDLSGAKIIPALIVIAVIPALFEEAFFRGLLLNGARKGAGDIAAVFITGMCFSLYHGSPEQTVYQFICGCAFALLALRADSLTPTVIIHFLNNAIIIILYAAGVTDAAGNLLISRAGEITLTVISAVCLVAAVVLLIFDKKPLKKRVKGETKNFFIYASVGIAVMALLWILSFFGVA